MVLPKIKTSLPGPKAKKLIKLDNAFVSPSYTRVYPLVAEKGEGLWIHDVDGNVFLDFTAGIAVTPPVIAIPKLSKLSKTRPKSCCTCRAPIFIIPRKFFWRKNCLLWLPGQVPKGYILGIQEQKLWKLLSSWLAGIPNEN